MKLSKFCGCTASPGFKPVATASDMLLVSSWKKESILLRFWSLALRNTCILYLGHIGEARQRKTPNFGGIGIVEALEQQALCLLKAQRPPHWFSTKAMQVSWAALLRSTDMTSWHVQLSSLIRVFLALQQAKILLHGR